MPFCRVNKAKLYYEGHGPKDQTPLVFIHGLSLTKIIDIDNSPHRVRIPQIEHFKTKRRIIVFDLCGFGQSDKPREKYSMKTFSEDLISLLNNLGIRKAIIVGYSMGGMVALRFVLDHPEMVDKLILISTTASMQLPYWKRMLVPLWARFQMRELPANLIKPRYVLSSCFSAVANFDVVSELPRIHVQTLIIHVKKNNLSRFTEQSA